MVLSLKILSILSFSLLLIPVKALATPGYVDNPIPYISSISPDSSNGLVGTNIIITITGNGFIPNSIARVNGADRATTFIDYSHLLVRLNPNDTYNTNGIYINIFNGFPGGGYSNAEYFTVNKLTPVASTNNNYSNTGQTENSTNENNDANDNNRSLAATALFGTPNSFLPSGLIQWIILAIIVLIIVIMVRRVFGAQKRYDDMPLKHE